MGNRTPKIPGRVHPSPLNRRANESSCGSATGVVADTITALTLRQAGYPPVRYIPINDVDRTSLRSSPTSTYCLYKDDASYYSIAGPDRELEDAIWTYEHPYAAVARIEGHLAFYTDRVEITESGDDSDAA